MILGKGSLIIFQSVEIFKKAINTSFLAFERMFLKAFMVIGTQYSVTKFFKFQDFVCIMLARS